MNWRSGENCTPSFIVAGAVCPILKLEKYFWVFKILLPQKLLFLRSLGFYNGTFCLLVIRTFVLFNASCKNRANVLLSRQQLTELKADDWTYDGKVNFSDPNFEIEGDKAIVNLKLNVGVAGNRNSHYTMVKENDEWLISNVVIDNY